MWSERNADNLPPNNIKIENVWSFTPTNHAGRHGVVLMDRDDSLLLLLVVVVVVVRCVITLSAKFLLI
jgi:hypothetical protein